MSKFLKGPKIESMDALMKQPFVMWDNGSFRKVYHLGWVQSWQLRYAWMLVRAGQLFQAIPKETQHDG